MANLKLSIHPTHLKADFSDRLKFKDPYLVKYGVLKVEY
jgi:hypothetical protein